MIGIIWQNSCLYHCALHISDLTMLTWEEKKKKQIRMLSEDENTDTSLDVTEFNIPVSGKNGQDRVKLF